MSLGKLGMERKKPTEIWSCDVCEPFRSYCLRAGCSLHVLKSCGLVNKIGETGLA